MDEQKKGFASIDEYIATFPESIQAILQEVRETIQAAATDATEKISYQMPTFKYQGRMLVSFAAFKHHCSFFPGAEPLVEHKDDLKGYETSKGTIRFPTDKLLPAALVKKLVKTRIAQIEKGRKY